MNQSECRGFAACAEGQDEQILQFSSAYVLGLERKQTKMCILMSLCHFSNLRAWKVLSVRLDCPSQVFTKMLRKMLTAEPYGEATVDTWIIWQGGKYSVQATLPNPPHGVHWTTWGLCTQPSFPESTMLYRWDLQSAWLDFQLIRRIC